jgi:hypothetical protein
MPALLLVAITIYIIISFAIGFLIVYPIPGVLIISMLAIMTVVLDIKRGAL